MKLFPEDGENGEGLFRATEWLVTQISTLSEFTYVDSNQATLDNIDKLNGLLSLVLIKIHSLVKDDLKVVDNA